MFALSFLIHLAIFFLIANLQFFTPVSPEEPVTYVDIATLPVASPQSGTPSPSTETSPAPPAAAAPAPQPEMKLPAPKPQAKTPAPKTAEKQAPAKAEKPKAAESEEDFNKFLRKAEQQKEAAAIGGAMERIKGKGGRTGMPGGKGTQAGSDYASYVQSRLKDAFAPPMTSQSKAPSVVAMITIGPDGKIAEYKVKKSSGDPIFDAAVARAVTLAERTLKPPPAGGTFKREFLFKPEGVK